MGKQADRQPSWHLESPLVCQHAPKPIISVEQTPVIGHHEIRSTKPPQAWQARPPCHPFWGYFFLSHLGNFGLMRQLCERGVDGEYFHPGQLP